MNAGLSQTKLIEYKMRSIFEASSGRPHGPFMGLGRTNIPRAEKRVKAISFHTTIRDTIFQRAQQSRSHGVYSSINSGLPFFRKLARALVSHFSLELPIG